MGRGEERKERLGELMEGRGNFEEDSNGREITAVQQRPVSVGAYSRTLRVCIGSAAATGVSRCVQQDTACLYR
jgi:hypothetical protein